MSTVPEPFCCEPFIRMAASFKWWYYHATDGRRIWSMPSIPNGVVDYRVNHCPSCGKECRSINLTEDQFKLVKP